MRIRDLLTGWRHQAIVDGIQLLPPVEAIGRVRAVERAPLRRMKDIVDGFIKDVPRALVPSVRVSPLVRFATDEGENAGMLSISVDTPEVPLERTLGLVVGDTSYALITATVAAPEYVTQFREIVELMTRGWFMCLGEHRRRRYLYDPPAGWHAIPAHHATRYYHPAYPKVVAAVTVHDARPTQVTDAELLDRMLFVETWRGLERDPPTAPTPLQSQYDLTGQLTRITGVQGGQRMVTLQGVYTDTRFTYILQLDAKMDALKDSLPSFSNTVLSARPVPAWAPKKPSSLIQWVD
jgi:hypothetical protein